MNKLRSQFRILIEYLADHCFDGCNVDGGDLQDKLVEMHFLKKKMICHEDCNHWEEVRDGENCPCFEINYDFLNGYRSEQ